MSDVSFLQSLMRSARASISAEGEKIAQIEEKLERLRPAANTVNGIYDECKGYAAWLGSYDVGEAWQGDRREEFEEKKSRAKNAADDYATKVFEVYTQMHNKITELENQKTESLGVISWGYRQLNNLQGALDLAFKS